MKLLSNLIRIIIATAGALLAGYAIHLGWRTFNFLSDHTVTAAETRFQETRLGAHVIMICLGIALVVLAIPRRRNEGTHRLGWQFFFGLFMSGVFISSFARYIAALGRENLKLSEEDISPKVTAIIIELVFAVAFFKWKATPSPLKDTNQQVN